MSYRLFELDPTLLTLFNYKTKCGVVPECLSSPEFLEHVTKVRSMASYPFIIDCMTLTLFDSTTLDSETLIKTLTIYVKVMVVIDAAVNHLDDLDSLEDFLLNLGRKHQAVGVKTQSFTVSIRAQISQHSCVCLQILQMWLVESKCSTNSDL